MPSATRELVSPGSAPGRPQPPGPPPPSSEEAQRARWEGYVALIVVQIGFGLFPVFGKWAVAEVTARTILGWRIAGGALALSLTSLLLYRSRFWPARADWGRLFLCAQVGVTLNMWLFLEGLERSTAVNAGLLIPVIPVFTFLIAVLLRHEPFDRARGLGIAIALAGTSLLVARRGPGFSEEHTIGNLMLIANSLCYATYLVIARPLLTKYPPLVLVAWVFLFSLWIVPWLAVTEVWWPATLSSRGQASLIYIVLVPTVLTYLLNAFALTRVSSSTTAVFIFLQPIITTVDAVVRNDERVGPMALAAGALVLLGTALVLRRPVAAPLITRTDPRA